MEEQDINTIFQMIDEEIQQDIAEGKRIPGCYVEARILPKLKNAIIIKHYKYLGKTPEGINITNIIYKEFTFESKDINLNIYITPKLTEKYPDYICECKRIYRSDYGEDTEGNPPSFYFRLQRR